MSQPKSMVQHQELRAMAEALAASIPPHLAKLTSPPISWMQIGNDVTVILADGRKFTASIQKINELMSAKTLPVEPAAPVLVPQGKDVPAPLPSAVAFDVGAGVPPAPSPAPVPTKSQSGKSTTPRKGIVKK